MAADFAPWHREAADIDEDARRESIDQRRARARLNHYCDDCRGHSGGPCDVDADESDAVSEQRISGLLAQARTS